MPFMFNGAVPINNLGEYRGLIGGCRHEVAAVVLSISSLLITFHHSLLVIGFFHISHEGKRKMRRGAGEVEGGGLTFKHHQKRRRSIHDIRLNEYMNSNETRPSLF